MARLYAFSKLGLLMAFAVLAATGCQDDGAPVSIGGDGAQPLFTESTGLNPCFDGHVAHNASNCSSCSNGDFTFATTASAATVLEDRSQSDKCGESQAVFVFTTSTLASKCEILSATLTFKVKTFTGLDVSQHRVRIFSKQLNGSCQSSLTSDDFVGCGSGYTDLGTVNVSGTGAYHFTVPNPNTTIAGIGPEFGPRATKFVIVDASDYTSGNGYSDIKIHSVEATASNRPVLNVVTYDCFNPCLDGNVFHDAETACDECDAGNFDLFDTTAEAISLEHLEPMPGGCSSYATGAMYFDTASLDDEDEVAGAKLIFHVDLTFYEGVNNPQIRIYAIEDEPECVEELKPGEFPACNSSAVSLGVVSITGEGIHTFTIPNPGLYINREGASHFLLADASTISYLPGGSGAALTTISSNDESLSRLRPRLQVQY